MKTAMDAYELPRLMPTMGGMATWAGDSARPFATDPFCGIFFFLFFSRVSSRIWMQRNTFGVAEVSH